MSIVFLVAGIWKASDPVATAVLMSQAKVPQSLSVATAICLAIAETCAGVMLLIPRLRRWGGILATLLMAAFIVYIGIHYNELRGAECSCFPWIKRTVGPLFFVVDGAMLALAIMAGMWARRPAGTRAAIIILGAVSLLTAASYGVNSVRHLGTKAPDTIAGQDGRPIPLGEGKVFIFFFNPQCLHCLEAGRKLAALNWGDTRFVGVPTENPQFGTWFLGKAGLTGKGPISTDLDALKKIFPFDLPPAGVALENGREKAMLLQFEDQEPGATLRKAGFVY
jgi:uncharacterized membrane protein YphA (DoxX/SURF4 family)